MKRQSWIAGILLIVTAMGCSESGEELLVEEQEEVPAVTVDTIANAVWAIDMGEVIDLGKSPVEVSETEADKEGALYALREHPYETMEAWQESYERVPTKRTQSRSRLLHLLDELCIPQSSKVLEEIAAKPLPARRSTRMADPGEHQVPSERDKAEEIQAIAIRALGSVSSAECQARAPRVLFSGAPVEDGPVEVLIEWTTDAELPPYTRMLAGEALLENHSEKAAALREELSDGDEWMLTPFEERRVEPMVDEVPPDPRPEEEPEPDLTPVPAAISYGCWSRVETGWDRTSTGDNLTAVLMWVAGHTNYLATRNYYDNAVDFQSNTWDEGLGWARSWDGTRPLRRAINSFWIIETASSTPNPSGDYSGGVINWAWDYVKNKTAEMEGSCDGWDNASTGFSEWGRTYVCGWFPWFCDERMVFKMPLWEQDVSVRAGHIVHETRHAAGYKHDGESCPREASCDERYSDRKANTLEVQWLAQFYRSANNASSESKRAALRRANRILLRAYDTCPLVQLNTSGFFYSIPASMCQ